MDYLSTGMAGNQVLEWADLDTEIKTAGLKDVSTVRFGYNNLYKLTLRGPCWQDPLAPPDL